MKIVIITGMSGAGKSSALRIFEDMGYYCMDNLPPQLMDPFLDLAQKSSDPISKVAVGVDIRGREFFDQLRNMLDKLTDRGADLSVLYLEARDEILIRRYKEKRRPHPLDKMGNIYDGIQREKAVLVPLRRRADLIIDSSDLTLGELKRKIDGHYLEIREEASLLISVTSFGYKHGILLDADLVMDVRFLPNPYYVPELKGKTGQDPEVESFVMASEEAGIFIEKFTDLLEFLIPYYIKEGKRTLVVGIGCTGGQHRSVALADLVGKILEKKGKKVKVYHRDRMFWKTDK
ncbi:RNase adapter RapZ [Kallipyga massiliensis]|uniref:RNase adapter RapZ n=1 Tax=Kallipyga massiliensis TaxID=1472764 RepID=UPI0004B435D9|nr:RNase adapter RapZ [Kallipyga massiliensis]